MNKQIKKTVLVLVVIVLSAGMFLLVKATRKAEPEHDVAVRQPMFETVTTEPRPLPEVIEKVETSKFENTWRPRPLLADTDTVIN